MIIFRFTKKDSIYEQGYYFEAETKEEAIAQFIKKFPDERFEVKRWL